MSSTPSPAELFAGTAMPPSRCTAIRALRHDGMSCEEVAFVLQTNDETVAKHSKGDCACPEELEPVEGRAKDTNDERKLGGGY